MNVVASILKFFFGTKSDKDRKQIQPYVDKILAAYPPIDSLSNDQLRAHSEALRATIKAFIGLRSSKCGPEGRTRNRQEIERRPHLKAD